MKKLIRILSISLLILQCAYGQDKTIGATTFNFGGYIKTDFLNTWYRNGDVGATSPLREFHLPGQIPVGPADRNFDLDYHAKGSRFSFDVGTTILGQEIHGFLEFDFLLSGVGDERVSNSYNPRIRHAYFEWDRLLIGQTWSSFMIVVVPDELDFAGAMDGLVFIRQPQVRYKAGSWWFALENPETTVSPLGESGIVVTDSEVFPDVVARKNFNGQWGSWSVAAIGRTLHKRDSVETTAMGYGITTGGKLFTGKRGDDVRIIATYGNGLGRYLAAGFTPSGVLDRNGKIKPIQTLNGYVAYNHYWVPQKWSSSFSVAAYRAFHDTDLAAATINELSYSLSGNIKWDLVPQLRFGMEYMYAYRGLLNNTSGAFHRLQFSAKYSFNYRNSVLNEKQ